MEQPRCRICEFKDDINNVIYNYDDIKTKILSDCLERIKCKNNPPCSEFYYEPYDNEESYSDEYIE